jgi:hypothetical protein
MHGQGGTGQTEVTGKDTPMLDLTPTNLTVNNMRIGEQLAKAERHHELTRGDAVAAKQPARLPAVQEPRISLISRLIPTRLRPA